MQQRLLVDKFGNTLDKKVCASFEKLYMFLWYAPPEVLLANPLFPKRIYINRLIIEPLDAVVALLYARNLLGEIETFDGCFNPRYQRKVKAGSAIKPPMSVHSWGLALDFNSKDNPLVAVDIRNREARRKLYVKWSEPFLDCWRQTGWDCGADWKTRLDGMHFQYVNPIFK